MPQIQLLDGKKIDFDKAINGFDLTKNQDFYISLMTLENLRKV